MLIGVVFEDKPEWYDDQPIDLGSGRMVKRGELKTLINDDLFQAVRIWKNWRRYGLHHGRGPDGECSETMEIIDALEDEHDEAIAAASSTAAN